MSQFSQTTPQTPQNNPGRRNNSVIYWAVILVLLAGCIYLAVTKNEKEKEIKANTLVADKKVDSLNTDIKTLQSDFDAASAKIDQLVSQNSKLDSALQSDKAAMAKLQGQIRTVLANKNATKAELAKAREMINMLNDKTQQLQLKIAELEKENRQLTGENKVLAKERDSTVEKNIALKKAGSVLHASNIRMEAIHRKKNGREKETLKAKKADELRITFDIDENRIAESGTKQIYLRILSPLGGVLSSPSNASGTLTDANGTQVPYSVLKNILLTQNQPVKDLTIDWHQDGDYARGTYNIEIYSEGYKVGSGSVELK